MSARGDLGNAYLIFGHKEMQYSAAPVDQNLEMALMADVSKIGPNGHMETRRQLPVCRVAPSVTGRQRGASIRGRANGSHPLS